MKDNYTDITIVLDCSGSMGGNKKATIEGFNKFLQEQKALCESRDEQNEFGDIEEVQSEMNAKLSLYQFNDSNTLVYDAVDILNVQELTDLTYRCNGGTALLDTLGIAITATGNRLSEMKEADRPSRVVVVVITDGQENTSCEYTRTKIFEMIEHQTNTYNWCFVFLGANQNAIHEAQTMGIRAGNSLTYANNSVGAKSAFCSVSSNMTRYRSGDDSAKEFYFAASDRATQTLAGIDPSLNEVK